jgi:hypothetical protein
MKEKEKRKSSHLGFKTMSSAKMSNQTKITPILSAQNTYPEMDLNRKIPETYHRKNKWQLGFQ